MSKNKDDKDKGLTTKPKKGPKISPTSEKSIEREGEIIIPGKDLDRVVITNSLKSNREAEKKSILAIRESFSGPLPPPEILAQYKEISPDLIKQIEVMAAKEQEHRHGIEDKTVNAGIEDLKEGRIIERHGQIFAFLIGTIAIISGTIIALCGYQIAASIIGGGGILGLVSAFIMGRAMKENDDRDYDNIRNNDEEAK